MQTDLLQAIFLGIVEGLTEFIPVSSTGHLILLENLIGFRGPPGHVFEIAIQLGAILAICVAYRAKIFQVVRTVHTEKSSQQFCINIMLAFLPAAIVGVLAHKFIKEVLFSPLVVSVALIIGGIIIILVEQRPHKARFHSTEELSFRTSLTIGLFQCLALIPGVSRSGATIIGSLLLGVERKTAAEFSFFLAIPTMFAATFYDLYKNFDALNMEGGILIAAGLISAFISALLVVKSLLRFVSTHGFAPFGWYRLIVGSVMLLMLI